ncbi:hypothetical protein HR12_21050 [Microbacterium sp. SUBG005]|nr:hypothetical protein HR12_21050 [Microbacterium sp. SUBG005]
MSDARDAARDKLAAAVEEFIYVDAHDDDEETGEPMAMGWALVFEYTRESLIERDASAVSVVTPATQYRGTSRGLFEMGADKFKLHG